MEVTGIETDILLRVSLQVGVPVDKKLLIKGVAYLLVVNVPAGILAANKLEVLVDKDLIVVKTYLLIKPGRWDFNIEKKWKILFVKYGV